MKSILICKDCLDQFESTKHDQCLNLINNVSQCQTPIYFTTCMGVCPLEKISVIELTKDVINSNKSKSFTLSELLKKIKNYKK
jgi:hypothetical protein